MRYRSVSDHLEDLTGGRAVDPGDFFELDEEGQKDEYNKDKIDRGVFIEAPETDTVDNSPGRDELLAEAKELGITGRTTMRNDELQTAINHAKEAGT